MKIEECALFSFLKLFYCLIRIIYIMKKRVWAGEGRVILWIRF